MTTWTIGPHASADESVVFVAPVAFASSLMSHPRAIAVDGASAIGELVMTHDATLHALAIAFVLDVVAISVIPVR